MVKKDVATSVRSQSTVVGEVTHRRDVGVISAVFLIVNRLIGTGIFATPSNILKQAGSPGLALILWLVGALISMSGLMVYMEFGSMIPKNGGEKNYLEYFYRKPRFLALCTYSIYVFLLGWAASNSAAFGEYILAAAGIEPGRWNMRLVGFACLTFSFLVHGLFGKYALYLQNLLGTFKVVVLLLIIVIGWVGWGGGGGIPPTHAFHNSFSGSTSGYGVVSALYNVIWSFIGYSNANYALAEAKNPERILKFAAPAALVVVSILYILANISYFGVVPLERIKGSGIILAADFFDIVWGKSGRTALSVFVALSALGNVLSVIYSQARIVQELGRDSILPFSRIWGSSLPFNSPFMALFEHWAVSVIILLAPPPGDAYNFIANLITYPLSVVNGFVGLALIFIAIFKRKHFPEWQPYIRATLPVSIFFFLSSLYLIAAPFVPPEQKSDNVYKSLPYYLHCVVGLALFGAGFLYWLIVFKLWPWSLGYHLDTEEYVDVAGWPRQKIIWIKNNGDSEETDVSTGPQLVSFPRLNKAAQSVESSAETFASWWDAHINNSQLVPSWLLKLPSFPSIGRKRQNSADESDLAVYTSTTKGGIATQTSAVTEATDF